MKIVGAILNPLFQCDECTIEAVFCTNDQFQAGKEEFLKLILCTKYSFDCAFITLKQGVEYGTNNFRIINILTFLKTF